MAARAEASQYIQDLSNPKLRSAADPSTAKIGATLGFLLQQRDADKQVQDDLLASLQFTQDEVTTLKTDKAQLQDQLKALTTSVTKTQRQVRVNTDQVKDQAILISLLDHTTKRKNLVVEGLDFHRGEDPKEVAYGLLAQLEPKLDPYEIDLAYRQGPPTSIKRTMIIVLMKADLRDRMLASKNKLQGIPNYSNVYISEDANTDVRKQKNDISTVARLAHDAGIDVKPRGRGVLFNGKFYAHSNLDELPDAIKLANAKTICSDTYIAYQSELAPLSNFFPCTILDRGITFSSVEQAFAYRKAKFAGRNDKAKKILDCFTALGAKQIAKSIECPAWKQVDEDHLEQLNLLKYRQSDDLKQLIISSGNKKLVEATSDSHWGAGVGLRSKAIQKGTFKGKNRGGEVLMKVRRELFRDMGIQQPAAAAPPPNPTPTTTAAPLPPATPTTAAMATAAHTPTTATSTPANQQQQQRSAAADDAIDVIISPAGQAMARLDLSPHLATSTAQTHTTSATGTLSTPHTEGSSRQNPIGRPNQQKQVQEQETTQLQGRFMTFVHKKDQASATAAPNLCASFM